MENTVAQFWLMCIQEDVRVILQLCQNTEDGKEKCSEYMTGGKLDWVTYGPVQVKQVDYQKNVAGTKKVNRTKIQVKFNDKVHSCTHLLYAGWPDHGVPESVATCREVRNLVHKYYEKKPIVIHCSAGVGRTGTFVAIEMVCYKLMHEENANFTMLELVKNLREQRMHAVQNDQQYCFIIRCVIEILVAEDCLSRNPRVIQFIQDFEEMVERKKKQRAAKAVEKD
uniref:Protein-tyrosine phosphatase n=2 Tax=Bursaphelenchus xylophilus TaxID=6326 RepID=A0A1I7S3R8_BURXY